MLVQVAGEAERIDPQLGRQLGDPAHRIAQRLPPGARHRRLRPGEGRVQMHVGSKQESDRGHGHDRRIRVRQNRADGSTLDR